MEKGKEWLLERFVRPEEESCYLEVPFVLTAEAERLDIAYRYEGAGEGPSTIDLGLKDPQRVRGWSGGARKAIFVSAAQATPGYQAGPLPPGAWAVLLGAYRVPPEGCRVQVRIAVQPAEPRWLKGELHSHTVHSDGTYTLEEAASIVEDLGCDFLATTDHNTVSQNAAHPWGRSIVFLPGMELTHSMGHANLLGSPEPVADFRVAGRAELDERLQEAAGNGALRVINHPFCPYCPWLWGMDAAAEAVEIWNGPWRELNQRALDWWQAQLAAGRRITAVGGSDVHRPHDFVKHAHPTAHILSTARTAEGILAGLAQGRVYLTYAPSGPNIEMTCGEYGIGDLVPRSAADAPVRIELRGLTAGDRVRFITEQGIAEETAVSGTSGGRFCKQFPVGGIKFIRAEVWRVFPEAGGECPALIANPIYFEP